MIWVIYHLGGKVRFPNLPNVSLIKYLNVEEELIKEAGENLGKYLNNLQSINVFF